MAITNGYCTLAEAKAYLLGITTTSAADDAVIEQCVEAASRAIDRYTRRQFYASTETRYYDTPKLRTLFLDADLLTVTTLTDGDGTVLGASDYKLMPLNETPKYGIWRKTGDWQLDSDGHRVGAITVAGTWGFSATAPHDVRQACMILAADLYRKRTGEGAQGAAITGAGVVLTDSAIPASVVKMLSPYIKVFAEGV